MAINRYQRYKIRISPDSHKLQGLVLGDIVRRQYTDRNRTIFSLMAVIESGIDVIDGKSSPYFVGALLEGDKPESGELLDFVRVTSLINIDRCGALYLTASDKEAPFLDVIDSAAADYSICYPVAGDGVVDIPDKTKYVCVGTDFLTCTYHDDDPDAGRVFRLRRTSRNNSDAAFLGIKQTIEGNVGHPERLLISFRMRASKPLVNVALTFGYTSGEKVDAVDTISVDVDFAYYLCVLTVEYPREYGRSFSLDLSDCMDTIGDWCEVGDLNIVRYSSLTNFENSTQVRIGKVSGIVDPVFGLLDGYGAYFQNIYATRNVNIAGTLTAGDGDGFSSTFYVGKIHKNVLVNSIGCGFSDARVIEGVSPAGIGLAMEISGDSRLYMQTAEWRSEHIGKRYCFSIWVKSPVAGGVGFYQDEHFLKEVKFSTAGEWERYSVSFRIRSSLANEMSIGISKVIPDMIVAAPQLESGGSATLYQATDEKLCFTTDYGAWFCKGGVGGTIQNPLLRFNEDGSISSCDGSFVINRDGTGHFADGRFRWTKDSIDLSDITIRWDDMTDESRNQLLPKYVVVESDAGTIFRNEFTGTVLHAHVYRGNSEITDSFKDEAFLWARSSSDEAMDKLWNDAAHYGKTIILSKGELVEKAIFNCEITTDII